jgi:uncharacterized membrane protein YidH (DUF202 family)
MGPLNILFAKLFTEYERKNDLPKFNITLYISFVYLLILFSLYLPLSVTINKKLFEGGLHYNKTFVMVGVFLTFGLVLYLTYTKYIKNKLIYRLTEKYQRKRISRPLLYILIVAVPLTLFLLSGTLTVLLTGGTILNSEFKGLLK